jgi:hypothetical protein
MYHFVVLFVFTTFCCNRQIGNQKFLFVGNGLFTEKSLLISFDSSHKCFNVSPEQTELQVEDYEY